MRNVQIKKNYLQKNGSTEIQNQEFDKWSSLAHRFHSHRDEYRGKNTSEHISPYNKGKF